MGRLCIAGNITVSVSGRLSLQPFVYNFQRLITPPDVRAVAPLSGSTAIDTVVTIVGTSFNADATVRLIELGANLQATGRVFSCEWRDDPRGSCNDTVTR